MIILSKKRFGIISTILLISLFVFVFQVASSKQTVQTVSLPVSNKVIVLDAGHGKPDEGAQSSNGTTEAETKLKITLKVQSLLEQSGATVVLTRSDENAIYDLDKTTLRQKKISDIHNRVKIGNESSADIFVSIHLNKISQQQYYGWQCFYKQNDEKSGSFGGFGHWRCGSKRIADGIFRRKRRFQCRFAVQCSKRGDESGRILCGGERNDV